MKNSKLMMPPSLESVKIKDAFWSDYQRLVREVVIPYQWDVLNDRVEGIAKSHAVENFKIAAGLSKGEFYGFVFQDSDVAKWIEAVAYSLTVKKDEKLEKIADEMIDIIEKAQQPDGYLDTYFIIKEPEKRFTDLHECHELYCAGHMLEAAVAYYNATGKRKLLDVMCRFVDYIDTIFGPEPEKKKGYPGHQELELALMKLYRVTGNEKYMNLAHYFLSERGKKPYYFDEEWEKRGQTTFWTGQKCDAPSKDTKYNQFHVPVEEQDTAVGHAVRAVYMYTAMADLAGESCDPKLLEVCRKLWDDVANKQMYITGGVGSTSAGEAFTFAYDLPNDTNYSETCASIGLIFFASRMLRMEAKSTYADVMERALYNTVISSSSLDGHKFYYSNPMEVWPEASEKNPLREHIKPVRQTWFSCACCPPNFARMISSLSSYVYTTNEDTVYCHLYIGSDAELEVGEQKIQLSQTTNYPWDETVKIQIESNAKFTLALRHPGWCRKCTLKVNGSEISDITLKDGYMLINRDWKQGDTVELVFEMPAEYIQANPKVRADAGKVAVMRGPVVYCLEETDNGKNLSALSVDINQPLKVEFDASFCGKGAALICGTALRTDESDWGNTLYRPAASNKKEVPVTFVPYFLWGNRDQGEMTVWVRGNE